MTKSVVDYILLIKKNSECKECMRKLKIKIIICLWLITEYNKISCSANNNLKKLSQTNQGTNEQTNKPTNKQTYKLTNVLTNERTN
jgi:hypothetical protein